MAGDAAVNMEREAVSVDSIRRPGCPFSGRVVTHEEEGGGGGLSRA